MVEGAANKPTLHKSNSKLENPKYETLTLTHIARTGLRGLRWWPCSNSESRLSWLLSSSSQDGMATAGRGGVRSGAGVTAGAEREQIEWTEVGFRPGLVGPSLLSVSPRGSNGRFVRVSDDRWARVLKTLSTAHLRCLLRAAPEVAFTWKNYQSWYQLATCVPIVVLICNLLPRALATADAWLLNPKHPRINLTRVAAIARSRCSSSRVCCCLHPHPVCNLWFSGMS